MALGPIYNASSRLLTENSGTLPDVSGGFLDYFQPMTFEQITKTVVGFQVQETTTPVSCYGLWQPMGARRLAMMPIGQRKWNHFTLHTQLPVPLQPDDVIVYLGHQYRCLGQTDYSLYGYYYYEFNDDFSGSGPTVNS